MEYRVTLTLEDDIWNWLDALHTPFMGFNWIDNLLGEDKEVAAKIQDLDEQSAEQVLTEYITQKHNSPAVQDYQQLLNKTAHAKLDGIISQVESITGKEFYLDEIELIITTFPRCPYDHIKGTIFFYCTMADYWPSIEENLTHELLHFQFEHYWRDNPDSLVHALDPESYEILHETITVVIDGDKGYREHAEVREKLKQHWEESRDFNSLIEFGIQQIASLNSQH